MGAFTGKTVLILGGTVESVPLSYVVSSPMGPMYDHLCGVERCR